MYKAAFFIVVFILLATSVIAQESPKYNFGSAQGGEDLTLAPGEEISTKLFFYNIFGNRITHISLNAGDLPEGWEVSIDPELHTTQVRVSGIDTEIEENLFVEPSEAVEEVPEIIPEGIEYIRSSVGLIGAKPVSITISVPDDAQLGSIEDISISGTAEWLGQAGSVAFNQQRTFNYKVSVISDEFTEEIVETLSTVTEPEPVQLSEQDPVLIAEPEVAESPSQSVAASTNDSTNLLISLLAVVIVLLTIIIIVLVIKKR